MSITNVPESESAPIHLLVTREDGASWAAPYGYITHALTERTSAEISFGRHTLFMMGRNLTGLGLAIAEAKVAEICVSASPAATTTAPHVDTVEYSSTGDDSRMAAPAKLVVTRWAPQDQRAPRPRALALSETSVPYVRIVPYAFISLMTYEPGLISLECAGLRVRLRGTNLFPLWGELLAHRQPIIEVERDRS